MRPIRMAYLALLAILCGALYGWGPGILLIMVIIDVEIDDTRAFARWLWSKRPVRLRRPTKATYTLYL